MSSSNSSRKINVLYLSYDGMTDPLGQSQVLSYLKLLSLKGYSFHILSFEKPEVFEGKKHLVKELIQGYDITWHPLPYTKKPPVLSTLKDIWRGWKYIKKLGATMPIDMVHLRGYILGDLALATKKRFSAKLIFDMRGWWADEKLESGLWASPVFKPVYNYFKRLEKQLFATSDYSISLTHVGSEEITKLGLKQQKGVGVIPTCVDFSIFKPYDDATRQAVRAELNIPLSSKVLLYSGSLGGNYGTDTLLELFKVFHSEVPDSILLILSRSDKDYVKQELAKHGVNEKLVRVTDSDYKNVHRYLMAGDYGVINYNRTYSTIGRSPTKLGEYWASGLPLIAQSKLGDLDYLVDRYPEGGVLFDELKAEDYKKAVKALVSKPVDKELLRKYAIDYYDLNQGAENYGRIYNQLIPVNPEP